MVNNIECYLQIIQMINIKVMNSVGGIRIGTVTALASKQDKSDMATGSQSAQISTQTIQLFYNRQP